MELLILIPIYRYWYIEKNDIDAYNHFWKGISLWKFLILLPTIHKGLAGMVSPGVLQSDIKDPHCISLQADHKHLLNTSFQYKKTGT